MGNGAWLLATLESMLGVLGLGLFSAITYARIARPTARLLFSERASIAPFREGWSLQFRVANRRDTPAHGRGGAGAAGARRQGRPGRTAELLPTAAAAGPHHLPAAHRRWCTPWMVTARYPAFPPGNCRNAGPSRREHREGPRRVLRPDGADAPLVPLGRGALGGCSNGPSSRRRWRHAAGPERVHAFTPDPGPERLPTRPSRPRLQGQLWRRSGSPGWLSP